MRFARLRRRRLEGWRQRYGSMNILTAVTMRSVELKQ